jgi:hypothetical protein
MCKSICCAHEFYAFQRYWLRSSAILHEVSILRLAMIDRLRLFGCACNPMNTAVELQPPPPTVLIHRLDARDRAGGKALQS